MPSAFEKKTKQQFKNCRKTGPILASEFEKSVISVTLGLFCKNSEYHLQTAQMITQPIARGFALSPKEISLPAQHFLKYREAIDALNHNIKFIIYANKLGTHLPVRDKSTQKHVETLIDLEFIQKSVTFENSPKAVLHNRQDRSLQVVYNTENFNQRAIEVLKMSKILIDSLEKFVPETFLIEEIKELKSSSFKRADTFIEALKSGKINLDSLQNALQQQKSTESSKGSVVSK